MARAMPVLPEDDSTICCPGERLPSFSASSIIALAARSFTLPPGFWPSSLRTIRACGFGLSEVTSTSGVLPMRSSTLACTALSPSDSRENGDLGAVGHLGVELVEVAHVVIVHVHVDELVEV